MAKRTSKAKPAAKPHGRPSQPAACKYCGLVLPSTREKIAHQWSCEQSTGRGRPVKTYECPHCRMEIEGSRALAKHLSACIFRPKRARPIAARKPKGPRKPQ